MMYVHGFMSGANGAKQRQLQKAFKGRYRVIAPELDGDPDRSLAVLNETIRREKPQIIVGTSLGGWMTMMCDSGIAELVMVNPVTAPCEELAKWLDVEREYFCKRLDGVQTYTMTREVLDKYAKYDLRRQIAYHGDRMHFLCSTNDELLGDRHIRTLSPYFCARDLTVVDDFGHQCRDAGLTHLIELLEKIASKPAIPYVPGMFRILSEEERAAAMARSMLLGEISDEQEETKETD